MENNKPDTSRKIKLIKENIQSLINVGKLEEARMHLTDYEKVMPTDIDIYSMRAVISMMEGNLNEAENLLLRGLTLDRSHFDLLYNIGFLYETKEEYINAFRYYRASMDCCAEIELRDEIYKKISELKNTYNIPEQEDKPKIVFFSKGDDKFIWDIITELSKEYETKKITIIKSEEFKLIDQWMDWADICWFEWCDDLIAYGSNLEIAKNKKIICRLHSYEAFTNYPSQVKWDHIDKLILISEQIQEFVLDNHKINKEKTTVIPNGIISNKWTFKQRSPGFNLAYVGYINYKKGPMLLLHTFKAIYDIDHRYKLYIAGQFQDPRDSLYYQQMIKEFGLESNIFFEGWQENIDKWLEDKNYILCTSVLESQNMSVMQAMSKGIKPIIHNFVGAREKYSRKCIWNTIAEAVEMIKDERYDSKEYRKFIEDNYSLIKQINKIKEVLESIINPYNYLQKFNFENRADYRAEGNYFLRQRENLEFFMNPWMIYNLHKTKLKYEVILKQIQNQFKYISELYFNGESNIDAYFQYFNYLLKLLQHEDIIKETAIMNLLRDIKKEEKLSIQLIEKILFYIYPFLKRKFLQVDIELESYTIKDEYTKKNFPYEDKLIKELYDKLFRSIEDIKKFIKTFIIHGSLSTLDYTKYSDVDTLIILKDEVFKSIDNIRIFREKLSKATIYLFEYDPLQHHKFFIITEMDLLNYPNSYLPVELFEYSTLVYGEQEIKLKLRECFLENLYSVWSMAYGFRHMYITKQLPNNLFVLKRYTSRLMLLPTLYLELFKDIYPYKKYSFDLAKENFSKNEWKSIEIATKLRDEWNDRVEIQLSNRFFYYTWKLSEKVIGEIYDSGVIKKYIDYFEVGEDR